MITIRIATLCLLVLSPAVTAFGQGDVKGTPKSVLIATKAPAVEGAVRQEIVTVYDEYMRVVVDALSGELLENGIRSRFYIHRDQSEGMRRSVMEIIIRDRYDGLIQVFLDPVATPSENSMYLEAWYLRVGTKIFERGYEKRYRLLSENSSATLSASFIAADFVNELRTKVFSSAK